MRTLPLVLGCLLMTGACEFARASELADVLHFARLGRNLEACALYRDEMLDFLAPAEAMTVGPVLLNLFETMESPARANAVRKLVAGAVEKAFAAAMARPMGARRVADLQQLLGALEAVPQTGARFHYIRGMALLNVGRANNAEAELAAAVIDEPACGDYHVSHARALWAIGRRVESYEELRQGVMLAPTQENAQLLTDLLRRMKRAGKADRVLSVAHTWAEQLASDDAVASPLRTLVAEIHLERKQLAPVMNTYESLRGVDRTWLVGAIVRTAREVGGRNASELATTTRWLTGIGGTVQEGAATFSRTAGDLFLAAGKERDGLRAYAAAVQSGDREAAELMERYRQQVDKAAPGEALTLLASGLKDVPEDISGAPRFLEFQNLGEAAAEQLARVSPNDDEMLLNSIASQINAAPNVRSPRVAMVQSYLKGDTVAALKRLDELSLTALRSQSALGSLIPRITPKRTMDDSDWSLPLQVAQKAKEAISSKELRPVTRLTRVIQMARLEPDVMASRADPILIDLNGNGEPDLNPEKECPVVFDIAGYGNAQQIQWLVPGRDGWLCEDTNGDGRINSGQELFGTAGGFADGFEKLCRRDRNHDGRLDKEELQGLLVWRDDGNLGVTDPGELLTVQTAGIESIEIPQVGLKAAVTIHGRRRLCWDVWPNVQTDVTNSIANNSDLADL